MAGTPEEGPTTPEVAKPKKVATAADQTAYMVVARQEAPSPNTATSRPTGGWNIVGTNLTARSTEHAVRIYAEKLGADQKDIVLVAVPARSWRPMKVTAKVTTALILEEAS